MEGNGEADLSSHPLSHLVDGSLGPYYLTDLLSWNSNDKDFYIDLGSYFMVVGFRVYPCAVWGSDNLNHIVMSVSNSTEQTGNVCTEMTQPAAHNSWNCYPCTEGQVIGQDLPTQVYYSFGRYVHFTFTQDANMNYLCINELEVKSLY